MFHHVYRRDSLTVAEHLDKVTLCTSHKIAFKRSNKIVPREMCRPTYQWKPSDVSWRLFIFMPRPQIWQDIFLARSLFFCNHFTSLAVVLLVGLSISRSNSSVVRFIFFQQALIQVLHKTWIQSSKPQWDTDFLTSIKPRTCGPFTHFRG